MKTTLFMAVNIQWFSQWLLAHSPLIFKLLRMFLYKTFLLWLWVPQTQAKKLMSSLIHLWWSLHHCHEAGQKRRESTAHCYLFFPYHLKYCNWTHDSQSLISFIATVNSFSPDFNFQVYLLSRRRCTAHVCGWINVWLFWNESLK